MLLGYLCYHDVADVVAVRYRVVVAVSVVVIDAITDMIQAVVHIIMSRCYPFCHQTRHAVLPLFVVLLLLLLYVYDS